MLCGALWLANGVLWLAHGALWFADGALPSSNYPAGEPAVTRSVPAEAGFFRVSTRLSELSALEPVYPVGVGEFEHFGERKHGQIAWSG